MLLSHFGYDLSRLKTADPLSGYKTRRTTKHAQSVPRTDCSGYVLKPATISFGSQGMMYRVRCGPLTATDQASLKRASTVGTAVRLVFDDGEILLSSVAIEMDDSGWFWIEGPMAEAQK